jgi:hypothetical protein
MTTNFEELFEKIPTGAKEGRWVVPMNEANEAVSFLKSKVLGIQYSISESCSDEDSAIVRFTTCDRSIKNCLTE